MSSARSPLLTNVNNHIAYRRTIIGFGPLWIGVIVVVLFATFTIPVLSQTGLCDEATIRIHINRLIETGFNQRDMSVVDEVIAGDVIIHPNESTREEFKEMIVAFYTAMPEGSASIEHVLVEDCKAFFVFHFQGRMDNPLAFRGEVPFEPTHEDFSLDFHFYTRFNGEGQLIEMTVYIDNGNFLIQIGATERVTEAAPAETGIASETITTSGHETRNTAIVMQAEEAGYSGNVDMLRQLYSPDYIGHMADGSTSGLDFLIDVVVPIRNEYPAPAIIVNDSVAQDNEVAMRLTVLPGLATGRGLVLATKANRWEISGVYRLDENGGIVESWHLYDQYELERELGMVNPLLP